MLLLDPWQADSYKRNQSVMRSTPPTQTDQHSALYELDTMHYKCAQHSVQPFCIQ